MTTTEIEMTIAKLITRQNGKTIFWNGHVCEGNRLVENDASTVCLWTRCLKHDVPANAAWEKQPDDKITCVECAAIQPEGE